MSGFHCHNSEFNSEERSKNFMEVLESFGKFWKVLGGCGIKDLCQYFILLAFFVADIKIPSKNNSCLTLLTELRHEVKLN